MKSLNTSTDKITEQGRAIARGIAEQNARKERGQAIADKRRATMLERAAEKLLGGSAM